MTRGQTHEICNQIENACKKHGANPEEVASNLIRENFFFNKTDEYLLGNNKREPVSRSFTPLAPVTSGGRTGIQLLEDLKEKSLSVGTYAKEILLKEEFDRTVTNGVTYYPGFIKGEDFSGSNLTTENIIKEALRREGVIPPAELAPLLRLSLSDEEIKKFGLLWLIPMHEPIKDSIGDPNILGLYANSQDKQLNACRADAKFNWYRDRGFVFLFPQTKE